VRALLVSLLLLALLPLLAAAPVGGDPDVRDTRLVSQPAISAKHIAFVYAEDLWVADRDGGNVRRLTSDTGVESLPVFSPDGKTIAFTAEYDGNHDV
jgi:tricorn protease